MPKRIFPDKREILYEYLCLRDGEFCQDCHAVPTNPISQSFGAQNRAFSDAEKSGRATVSASANDQVRQPNIVLEIDHVNEDKNDWRLENLQLLCKSHNVGKSNRLRPRRSKNRVSGDLCVCVCSGDQKCRICRLGKEGQPGTRIGKTVVDYAHGSPEMQASGFYELAFRDWVLRTLRGTDHVEKEDLIHSGAEIVGCSSSTAERYLRKLTSSAGPLLERRDMLGRTVILLKLELAKTADDE